MSYREAMERIQEAGRTQCALPRYQCHKKVWALKIGAIDLITPTVEELEAILNGGDVEFESVGAVITPENKKFGIFGVSKEYVNKHDPQIGGYFVVYDDGYKSYSPAKAFEDGYTLI